LSAKKLSDSILLIKEPITVWQQYISGMPYLTANREFCVLNRARKLKLVAFAVYSIIINFYLCIYE
jgi:hypothetical protein